MTTTFIIYILHKMKLFKKQIRFIWYMECPTWLWRLIEKHARHLDNIYLPKNEWSVYYYDKRNDFWSIYEQDEILLVKDYKEAKKIQNLKKFEVMKEQFWKMDIDIERDYDEISWKFDKLQKENEELRNLPPVEVEKVQYSVDPIGDVYPSDDPRSTFRKDWENAKIQKK
jgi:hypothetical protein